MHLKLRLFIAIALALFLTFNVFAQGNPLSNFPNYGLGSELITSTPSTQGGSAGAYWNPAGFAAMREFEASFGWNDHNINRHRMDNWGLFLGGEGIGFSMKRNDFLSVTPPLNYTWRDMSVTSDPPTSRVDDYQIALGGGDPANYWGVSWNWARGAASSGLHRDDHVTVGSISRPFNFLSIGNAASLGIHHNDYRGISDIGVRPLQNHRLTVFGDAAYGKLDNFSTLQWGAGLEIQPINGIRIAGKMQKAYPFVQDKIFTLSLGLSLDGTGFQVAPHYDKKSKRMSTDYLLRLGEQEPTLAVPNIFQAKKHHVVEMSLNGQLVYQKARFLDAKKFALTDMLNMIEKAKNDPSVGGLALNLSGFEGSPETMWELREKLSEFKAADKKVFVYMDRAGMTGYNFASVADYLWMDPQGQIFLPGYCMGRTFWKGFLEKIGIGSEEWRFFTYKSAFEAYSRKNMSEPDREQRLALINDFYSQWQKQVSESRKLTPEALRADVDSMGFFTAEAALQAGLVDSIGRWDDAKEFVKKALGKEPEFITEQNIATENYADPNWGEPPKVAVVYAIGECDMDTGIKGRYTSKILHQLASRKDVKAVVLRADSPGGDALPSDLVADQMKQISKNKPMIVSQGQVAASGGYWISMNGDRIFTSPYCITGSIGVIGGWMWNNGFTEKTGFTSDRVTVGDHADLGFGVTLPFIGLQIPDRNLNEFEHLKMEKMIRGSYSEFTKKVAAGRNLQQTYVDSIGQGRVWSGTRALDLKLTDEIGGLDKALAYARTKANLPARGPGVTIIEFPPRPFINPMSLMNSPSMAARLMALIFTKTSTVPAIEDDYELATLRRINRNGPVPIPMTPPEDLPAEDSK